MVAAAAVRALAAERAARDVQQQRSLNGGSTPTASAGRQQAVLSGKALPTNAESTSGQTGTDELLDKAKAINIQNDDAAMPKPATGALAQPLPVNTAIIKSGISNQPAEGKLHARPAENSEPVQ